MRRFFCKLSLCIAAATFFGVLIAGSAANATDDGAQTSPAAPSKKKASGLQLVETKVESFSCTNEISCVVVPGDTYTALDSEVKLTCTADCTIIATGTVQMYGQNTANNQWAICLKVDGTVLNNNCPLQAPLPINLPAVGPYASSTAVSVGTHKVQTVVFANTAAVHGMFQITYQVFQ